MGHDQSGECEGRRNERTQVSLDRRPCAVISCYTCAQGNGSRCLQVRQAAEVHRQVRKYIRTVAKPGVMLSDMCEKLENTVGVRGRVCMITRYGFPMPPNHALLAPSGPAAD